jgi:hypothetical protein
MVRLKARFSTLARKSESSRSVAKELGEIVSFVRASRKLSVIILAASQKANEPGSGGAIGPSMV